MKKDIKLSLTDPDMKQQVDGILGSSDLGLLKLSSPDLEKLIIQSNGMSTSTPTSNHFLYPKHVTDEQEFAEGFVKALEDLHKQNLGTTNGALDLGASIIAPVSTQLDPPVYTNLNSYGNGPLGTTVNYSTDTVPFPPPPQNFGVASSVEPEISNRVQPPKEEPQTVPDVQSFGESPPLSPLDMDSQERIKADRKRLRNRIAASKCRRRKLERISRLEDKVTTLKSQNTDLASTANVLREQVAQLKEKVLTHVNNGCQLLPQEVQVH
ncbi:transcription factor JunD-like [Corythoichthys intestinalis]|uniref:transcription factor JunD-like n=1 Tax=Corythoichthys intestinalis TaxID=161448 RepID=UPI0025A5572D|nr:transcription factor JunD-like [Corythoichthys intestinalis]XP_061791075.1 transcription factor JunD-like [Nerophis lumbriciformis]